VETDRAVLISAASYLVGGDGISSGGRESVGV
jgi:hypothetical protein